MSAAILGLLTALPQLLTMINNFSSWITKVSGGDVAGYVVRLSAAFEQLNNAKTPQDNANAAQAIAEAIAGMPAK
jgi:hypothetical protein